MATKTIREHFVNTYGTDLLLAYFDPGAGANGAGRYNFASYSICNDRDWVKAIGSLRTAACLFKLPIDASASVDIMVDTEDPNSRTTFFVQIHRSSHLRDGACTVLEGANQLTEAGKAAVKEVQQSVSKALDTLASESLPLIEAPIKAPPPPRCSVSVPCGGSTTIPCVDPNGTQAVCEQAPTGEFQIVCVPVGPTDESKTAKPKQ